MACAFQFRQRPFFFLSTFFLGQQKESGRTACAANDIISYAQLVAEERINLQKGMNFGIGKNYSVFLMSVRKGAPYADEVDRKTGNLIYEGHDQPKTKGSPDPKTVDQPLTTPRGPNRI